ncbi:ABC transporter substrate-binding protein [Fimbriimonas ginsengisoli]|uniref:Branched-chain amino acid ABC transporter, amino acid-binding protein n=1 Tax=Fimbriimonas ginsengisoli Gsoil 348 TaxID=661478 RepID=A0A068NYB9_FIMGI|nr:ABC transporter substrate-binding protein [Fimbriimonas ginsengisoli]AIE86834.1 branched-chain amino acid ABC transporter, amino acid-binding protein [Fimbriimonas ginsengisoli Gsoil 348]
MIGLIADLDGDLKPWGDDSVLGARLAVDEFNRKTRRAVKLEVSNSASKPEQGRAAAELLLYKGAIGLIGGVASGITSQIAEAARATKTPVIATLATRPDLLKGRDWLFRVCYRDEAQGRVMARFAYGDLGLRRAAIATDVTQPYSVLLSNNFRSTFRKLGGEVVADESYAGGDTRFESLAARLKEKQPAAVYISGYFNEAGPMVRQIHETMPKTTFLGGDGWDSAEILASGGEAILGAMFTTSYVASDPYPANRSFLKRWRKKFGGLPTTSAGPLTYDATKLMLEAMQRSHSHSRNDLRRAIAGTVGFKGCSGTVTLRGRHGEPDKRMVIVRLKRDGQWFAKAFEHP